MGLSIGIGAGVLGLTGLPVIIVFGVFVYMSSYMYINRFLQIDEQDFNDQELLLEGIGNSIGLFLLSWIVVYSYL